MTLGAEQPPSPIRFKRLLLTGANGHVGGQMRPRLKAYCDTLRLSRRADMATAGAGEEIRTASPQGKAIGFVRLPERCANLCFGGPKNNRLYMASSHSLYALYAEAHGAV